MISIINGVFSLVAGFLLIPTNVIIHEIGHYIPAKLLCKASDVQIIFRGFAAIDSYVTRSSCEGELLNQNIAALTVAASGPLVETIAIYATAKLIGGRNAAIASLPHLVHIVSEVALPLLGSTRGDFVKIRHYGGSYAFSIFFALNMFVASSLIFQIFKKQSVVKKINTEKYQLKSIKIEMIGKDND